MSKPKKKEEPASLPDRLAWTMLIDDDTAPMCQLVREEVAAVLRKRGWGLHSAEDSLEETILRLSQDLAEWTEEEPVLEKAANVYRCIRFLEHKSTGTTGAAVVIALWSLKNSARQNSAGVRDAAYEKAKEIYFEDSARQPSAVEVLARLQQTEEGTKWKWKDDDPDFDPQSTFPVEFSRWKKLFALDLFR